MAYSSYSFIVVALAGGATRHAAVGAAGDAATPEGGRPDADLTPAVPALELIDDAPRRRC